MSRPDGVSGFLRAAGTAVTAAAVLLGLSACPGRQAETPSQSGTSAAPPGG